MTDGAIEVEVNPVEVEVEVAYPKVEVEAVNAVVAVSTASPQVKVESPTNIIEVGLESADVEVSIEAHTIDVDVSGSPGPPGPPGPPGLSGSIHTGEWRWTTKSTDASTPGQIGNNSGSGWWATALHINQQTDANTDATIALATIGQGDYVRVQQKTAGTKVATYQLTGPGVDQGAWWSFPVTLIEESGLPPNNSTEVAVTFAVKRRETSGDPAPRYTHLQQVMSPLWVVEHGLGCHPQVSVEDAVGNVLHGAVTHLTNYTLTVGFAFSITGRANCV